MRLRAFFLSAASLGTAFVTSCASPPPPEWPIYIGGNYSPHEVTLDFPNELSVEFINRRISLDKTVPSEIRISYGRFGRANFDISNLGEVDLSTVGIYPAHLSRTYFGIQVFAEARLAGADEESPTVIMHIDFNSYTTRYRVYDFDGNLLDGPAPYISCGGILCDEDA